MRERVKKGLYRAWTRLVHEERGAQTLEYLALGLLILAVLAVGSSFARQGEVGEALVDYFKKAIEKLSP